MECNSIPNGDGRLSTLDFRLSTRPAILRLLPFIALVAAILAIPNLVFKPSETGGNYYLTVLIYVGINTILAVGLNLLMGYAGQVSLGHAAFYGLGAYASAVLTTRGVPAGIVAPAAAVIAVMASAAAIISMLRAESGRFLLSVGGFLLAAVSAVHFGLAHPVPYILLVAGWMVSYVAYRMSPIKLAVPYAIGAVVGLVTYWLLGHATGGMSPWYAMAAGLVFTCLIAYLIGSQALKLHGHYLAMATLGFGVIIAIILVQWEPMTGGTSGIYGIPSLQLGKLALDNDISVYYLVWALVAVVIALSANIVNSRIGRAFRAVHGSEVAAASLGVDATRYKVQVFVLSAALASIAGSIYAHYVTFISPEPFGFKFSIELVVMVVIGGLASIWGAVFGAATITILGELLRGLGTTQTLGAEKGVFALIRDRLGASPSDFDVIIFGLILMLIMIYMPNGLLRTIVDSAKSAIRLARRKKAVE